MRFGVQIIILFWLSTLSFCSKDRDPPGPLICGCEATGNAPISNQGAVVVNTTSGFFYLSAFSGYYQSCNGIESQFATDGLQVRISGTIKATCNKPDDIYKIEKQNYSTINSISIASDSLFNDTPFHLQIIRSEDYGFSPGYGYRITYGTFKILQATIPAIGGNKPFKTTTDAFKTAVLVCYKLNTKTGSPSLTVQDLSFLKVLY